MMKKNLNFPPLVKVFGTNLNGILIKLYILLLFFGKKEHNLFLEKEKINKIFVILKFPPPQGIPIE